MRIPRTEFEALVAAAFAAIPERIRSRFQNIVVLVANEPIPEQLRDCDIPDGETLYGYYDGVPLADRANDGEPMLPDRVFIFQRPLEEDCATLAELSAEVGRTLRHELAHHLGIEDDRLEELGKY